MRETKSRIKIEDKLARRQTIIAGSTWMRERERVRAGRNKARDNGGDEEGRERHGTQREEKKRMRVRANYS